MCNRRRIEYITIYEPSTENHLSWNLHKCVWKNNTDFLKEPSFPATTFGLLMSPSNNISGGTSYDTTHSLLTSNCETMRAAFEVFPNIARSKLPAAKNFVGLCLSFVRELGVDCARVDEERGFGQRAIFLDR
jgi:hypothetical protein